MKTDPVFTSKESLIPSLFRMAGQAGDASVTKPAPKDRSSLAEMMLEPKRLEAILKSIGRKRRLASRRTARDVR